MMTMAMKPHLLNKKSLVSFLFVSVQYDVSVVRTIFTQSLFFGKQLSWL